MTRFSGRRNCTLREETNIHICENDKVSRNKLPIYNTQMCKNEILCDWFTR